MIAYFTYVAGVGLAAFRGQARAGVALAQRI
jgi:hypothetical protein